MVPYQLIQSVTIRHHADEASHVTQRNYRISSYRKVFLAGLWICLEQGVHQSKELHYAFVLSDVFVALEQEDVFTAIISSQAHFSWVLLA